MGKMIDLTGRRFGRLVVEKKADNIRTDRGAYWVCKCDCGNIVTVRGNSLKYSTKSCGCLKKEVNRKKCIDMARHNMSRKRIYHIWAGIKTRCYNKKSSIYKYYGERGITMCKDWKKDFTNFYNWAISNGYNDNLSIDRLNNEKSYSPENCRWATDLEQANNKRSNHFITIKNETRSLSDWQRILKIDRGVYNKRVKRGWNVIDALTKPVRYYQKKKEGDSCGNCVPAC